MKLIDLIFELVRLYVPIKQEDWARMKDEADKDLREWHPEMDNKLKATYAKYNSYWWFQLAVAVSFIPLSRAIARYMNPKDEEDEEL